MTISERLFQLFEEEEKRPADLCKILNASTSMTSSWKSRNTDPPAKYILTICEFLDVTPEYFLSGEGPRTLADRKAEILNSASTNGILTELSPEEHELLKYYKQLPTELKAELKGEAKGYVNALKYTAKTETKIS